MTDLEPLESRRLLAIDFGYYNPTGTGGPGYVLQGQTIQLSYRIQNHADSTATATIGVQYRLIPIPAGTPDPKNPDFYHSAAIVLAEHMEDDDFVPGGIGVGVTHALTYPANVPIGRYALMSYLDSTNVYTESVESNNYVIWAYQDVIRADGVVVIDGTAARDIIDVVPLAVPTGFNADTGIAIKMNGQTRSIGGGRGLTGLEIRAAGGDDVIVIDATEVRAMRVDGGDGNDKIVGGGGNDFLVGGAGKDVLDGGSGNDRLNGNGGNDKLLGNAGADRLYGYAGNDYLEGGSSNDRLEGGVGVDVIYGAGGDDRFFTRDAEIDQLFGGSGTDSAQRDVDDVLASVEIMLT